MLPIGRPEDRLFLCPVRGDSGRVGICHLQERSRAGVGAFRGPRGWLVAWLRRGRCRLWPPAPGLCRLRPMLGALPALLAAPPALARLAGGARHPRPLPACPRRPAVCTRGARRLCGLGFFDLRTHERPRLCGTGALVVVGCEKIVFAIGRPGGDRLSRVLRRSIIGAGAFHGRVRNGIGCGRPARTTRSANSKGVFEKLVPLKNGALRCFPSRLLGLRCPGADGAGVHFAPLRRDQPALRAASGNGLCPPGPGGR
jgi:hypothetical protein